MFKKDKDNLLKLLTDNGVNNPILADEILVLLGLKKHIKIMYNDIDDNEFGCVF